MKVLLAGGSGFVGRNLINRWPRPDHEIFAPGHQAMDLCDYRAVVDTIDTYKPDIIVHAAGRVGGIKANLANQYEFMSDNLRMGLNLIQAAQTCGVPRLINLASSCMYSPEMPCPWTEEQLFRGDLEPSNRGYAAAKIQVARAARDAGYKTLIPVNLYGPWDRFDDAGHLVGGAVAKVVKAVQDGGPVRYWGSGSAIRELLYAGELADCIWRAVEEYDTLPPFMNVGDAASRVTVAELYDIVAEVAGYDGPIESEDGPEGPMDKRVDSSPASRWGWTATTALDAGIRATVAYYRDAMAA